MRELEILTAAAALVAGLVLFALPAVGEDPCFPVVTGECMAACCSPDECTRLDIPWCEAMGGVSGPPGSNCDTFVCEPALECRVTGGGHDEFDQYDGSMGSGTCPMPGGGIDRYTFGGQAGAPTATQPQPFGEWTHHQKSGPDGMFVFHAGTASAPMDTEIDFVECSDPGWCKQARPAPAKQIDFYGVGSFRNVRNPSALVEAAVTEHVTLHYFHVHQEDLGEPGGGNPNVTVGPQCGPSGNAGTVAPCDCPDFYSITIHAGQTHLSPVIYHVEGYEDGGNFQIHPPID